eukprot:4357158-Pleurochrysis_carterae.AAC.1
MGDRAARSRARDAAAVCCNGVLAAGYIECLYATSPPLGWGLARRRCSGSSATAQIPAADRGGKAEGLLHACIASNK